MIGGPGPTRSKTSGRQTSCRFWGVTTPMFWRRPRFWKSYVAATVSGSVSTATLDYASYGSAVNFAASNASGATTGVGTTWSGVTTVVGSAATSDTVSGSGVTYDNFNATTKGTFKAAGISVSAFENINDAGAATVDMSGTTTGGVSGNVTTAGGSVTLAGGNQIGGNLNMNSAGTAHMGTAGVVSGSVSTATLDYANYASAVNFDASNASAAAGARSISTSTFDLISRAAASRTSTPTKSAAIGSASGWP